MDPSPADPQYPSIYAAVLRVVFYSLLGRVCSFRSDALSLVARLRPAPQYFGLENLPAAGPCLLTANHYSRAGFSTAWIALGISAVIPREVTWITVTEWVYPGQRREILLRPVMRFILKHIRKGYGFLAMPTMVRGYATPQQRTAGVRAVLHAVQQNPSIILGLTPEGMDFPGGQIGTPPPGAGKFMLHLNRMGLPILPVAVSEIDQKLTIRFGKKFDLDLPPDIPAAEIDPFVSRSVMDRIARLRTA